MIDLVGVAGNQIGIPGANAVSENVMAAIIDFPKEASVWRRDRAAIGRDKVRLEGKLLLFTGVRYTKYAAREAQSPLVSAVSEDSAH